MLFFCFGGMAAEEEALAGKVLFEPKWEEEEDYPIPVVHPDDGGATVWVWQCSDESQRRMTFLQSQQLLGEEEKVYLLGVVPMGKKYVCSICMDAKQVDQFHPLQDCRHPPFCSSCMHRSAIESLHGKGNINLVLLFISQLSLV